MPMQCADLAILDDSILESDETFSIRLSSLNNQVHVFIATEREQAQVIIREDNTDCKCMHAIVPNAIWHYCY